MDAGRYFRVQLMEVWILFFSFTIHPFLITIIGILLGFIYCGEQNPVMKSVELTIFLSIALNLFGPAGRTAILTLLFGICFYYGWVVRGNAESIESIRKRRLFLLAAASLGLVVAYASAFFLKI